jgi:hypothetical protein
MDECAALQLLYAAIGFLFGFVAAVLAIAVLKGGR